MSLKILQPSTCSRACLNCPKVSRKRCDGHSVCSGYGSAVNCPPLIVLAVAQCALAALAAIPRSPLDTENALPA